MSNMAKRLSMLICEGHCADANEPLDGNLPDDVDASV